MSNEAIPSNRGHGTWSVEIYMPSGTVFENIKGFLVINKDHYTIYEDAELRVTLLNLPSQNVAWLKRVEE